MWPGAPASTVPYNEVAHNVPLSASSSVPFGGMDTVTRPLLLLDVDGPLNPWMAKPSRRPEGYSTHRMRPSGWEQPYQKPLRVWLNHGHGADLLALPYSLVWATTWAHEANEWIGPHLGLPELPFIAWPEEQPARSPYWKGPAAVRWEA